jgi:hypothetical protein
MNRQKTADEAMARFGSSAFERRRRFYEPAKALSMR